MNEEMKLLLKLLLEQEEQTEAGQKVTSRKKRLAPEPVQGIDMDPVSKANAEEQKRKEFSGPRKFREEDFQRVRQEMYQPHESNASELRAVPIWEKYALTVSEASKYFHLSEKKLREMIKADKYADYLMWNGGRVFIKRKKFEDFLNSESSI